MDHRRDRAKVPRTDPARSRPAQGRIPGHAGARVAQSTGPDPAGRDDRAFARSEARTAALEHGSDRAPGRQYGGAAGRLAGRVAHHPRQARIAKGCHRPAPCRRLGAGSGAAGHRGAQATPDCRVVADTLVGQDRLHPHRPGHLQPADQRIQVHTPARNHSPHGAARKRGGRDRGRRRRDRHSARLARARVRDVHPGAKPALELVPGWGSACRCHAAWRKCMARR